jgi:hypothetical protein
MKVMWMRLRQEQYYAGGVCALDLRLCLGLSKAKGAVQLSDSEREFAADAIWRV